MPGRTAVAVLGGANELIAAELLHGAAENVGQLAPDIVYLITLPFLGPEGSGRGAREDARRDRERGLLGA